MSTTDQINNDPRWKDLVQRTNSLKGLFSDIVPSVERKIPEVLFVKHFLAWFAGEQKDTDGQLMRNWRQIAGSVLNPVMIIDETGADVIKVPPLHDRNVVPIRVKRAADVGFMLDKSAKVAALNPNLADKQLEKELEGNYLADKKHEADPQLVAEWKALLTHFGKGETPTAGPASTAGGSDEIELEYE